MFRLNTQLIIVTIAFLLTAFFFVSPTPAQATNSNTNNTSNIPTIDITKARGTVLDPSGNPVKFARVYGTCDGDTARGITNSKGQFLMYFVNKDKCKAGSTVTVTLEKDGQTYNGSGIVQLQKDGKYVDINFIQISFTPINVPEYNSNTIVIAVFISALIYFLLVSRKPFSKLLISSKR